MSQPKREKMISFRVEGDIIDVLQELEDAEPPETSKRGRRSVVIRRALLDALDKSRKAKRGR